MRKRVFSIGLILAVVFSLFTIVSPTALAAPTTVNVTDYASLQSAITSFNNGSNDMNIIVKNDITLTYKLVISNKTNALKIYCENIAYTLKRNNAYNTETDVFLVDGSKLVLQNIIIDGTDIGYGTYGIINVSNSGELHLSNGSVLRSSQKYGVYAPATANSFISMEIGSVIKNTTLFGVFVGAGNTFKMYGGEITSDPYRTGGGVYVSGGTFEMYGGKITGNNSNNAYEGGAGVFLASSAVFNMEGGEISNNKSHNVGGGIYVFHGSTFNMSGGIIKDNEATNEGGGIHVENSSVNMTAGEIRGNSSSINGGGVSLDFGANFKMTGGIITENVLRGGSNDSRNGGGVSPIKSSSWIYLGGTAKIMGNILRYQGGEIKSNLGISNRSVLLGTGASGNGVDAPKDGMQVWVNGFLLSDVIFVDTGANDVYAGFFHSDKDEKKVIHENGQLKLVNIDADDPISFVTPNADFSATQDYTTIAPKVLRIKNTGSAQITNLIASLTGAGFEISEELSSTSIAPGGEVTISVRPKTGLAASPTPYTGTLTIAGDGGVSVTASLSFMVNSSGDVVYGDLNGGNGVAVDDLVLMMRYFSIPGVSINKEAANVNVDEALNTADLILLMKYFSRPGIILGPQ